MKPYKILWPLSILAFFTFVLITCIQKFPGYQLCISLSGLAVIVFSCLAVKEMVIAGRSLSSRLTSFFIETRQTPDDRISVLLNSEPTRERVEELITHLREKSKEFESVEEVSPPKNPLTGPPESRLSRVLRDNYPL